MPKFILTKVADNEYDSEVSVTFKTDLRQTAEAHYEDFLKASGFDFPSESEHLVDDNVIPFPGLVDPSDFMWDETLGPTEPSS